MRQHVPTPHIISIETQALKKFGFPIKSYPLFGDFDSDPVRKNIEFIESDKCLWYNRTPSTIYYYPYVHTPYYISLNQEIIECHIIELHLKNCRDLHRLPKELIALKKLETLHISNCPVEDIDIVSQLSNLKELVLDHVSLKHLSPNLIKLKSLERFALINTQLNRFPIFLSKMPNLKRIVLKKLQLAIDSTIYSLPKLDPSIWDVPNLEELVIIGFNTPEISVKLGNWMNLERFHFEGICSKPLPDSIGQCKKLEELILHGVVPPLPKSLANLSLLKTLHLSNELILGIPNSIHQLHNLEYVLFRTNSNFILNQWPEQFQLISNLTHFKFEGVCNDPLPEWFGNFHKIIHLSLKGIKGSIPETFGKLKNLRSLTISNSNIHVLALSFCHLNNLEFLTLTNCNLKELPENFGELKELIEL
ncbi:MAG: leucine-rich repeat domain-containing protein, partial [Promethearchaeota archaeon]